MTKDEFTDVLYKGLFYEWWCLKAVPSPDISNSQMCFIDNNRALVVARSVLSVTEQEI